MKKYARRDVIKSGILAAIGCSPLISNFNKLFGNTLKHGQASTLDNLVLWYPKPAEKWLEALPIGNGRLGAMIFGDATKEQISISEDTLWTGAPYQPAHLVPKETLDNIRKLSFEGKLAEAQKLAKELQGHPNREASYQTVGVIELNFPNLSDITDYRRELDIKTGIVTVLFTSGGVQYKRESFASYPKHIVVTHITASKPG